MTNNQKLKQWVQDWADWCQPDNVYWCDGSEVENQRLLDESAIFLTNVQKSVTNVQKPVTNVDFGFNFVEGLVSPFKFRYFFVFFLNVYYLCAINFQGILLGNSQKRNINNFIINQLK